MASDFSKKKIALRYQLIGLSVANPEWSKAVRAMDIAEKYHTGLRKDGVTPEIQHQYEIALYLLTLVHSSSIGPAVLSASLLHDLYEDYGKLIDLEEIKKATDANVVKYILTLSKIIYGAEGIVKKTNEAYFDKIANCIVSSIVKGADRINNLQSMKGVFSREKQLAYIEEAKTYFLPMLKKARRQFPEEVMVYENIKLMMKSQIHLIS